MIDVWQSLNEIPGDYSATAVTIGKFDGLHLGHQKLIAELVEASGVHQLAPIVVTFDRHPDALLNPSTVKLPLIGQNQKQKLIEASGVTAMLNLAFDQELAALTPEQFIKTILVDKLKAKLVLVGEEFKFGAAGAGDIETLRLLGEKYGFTAKSVSAVTRDGVKVSTTRIRDLLDEGNVKKAAELLGRNHSTTGVIEHGLKIGRTIGFPTANMSRECEGYLPLDGVYGGWLYADGRRMPAALSVGINETFQAVPRLIEAFVIDEKDLDLYDKVVTLEYVDFIRPAAKFNGVEDLVAEINRDIDKIRNLLGMCWSK